MDVLTGPVEGEIEAIASDRVYTHEVGVDLHVQQRDRPVGAGVQAAGQPEEGGEPFDGGPAPGREPTERCEVAPREASHLEADEAGELDQFVRRDAG